MTLKNEALQNLWVRLLTYNSCDPKSVINLFKECDEVIEGEIAAIKAELTDANRYKDLYSNSANNLRRAIFERGDELRKANNQIEALKKENSELRNGNKALSAMCESRLSALFEARKNAEQYKKSFMANYEENFRLNDVVGDLEKEINTLKKKIHELEEENVHKRPWHGDGNAIMTGARTWSEMLAETIEFQNKKIEELEAEKARLKLLLSKERKHGEDLANINGQLTSKIEALKKANSALRRDNEILWSQLEEVEEELDEKRKEKEVSYGHEFEFGDKVFLPWSCGPYMYIKPGELYNPRTKSCVYCGKTQHLKWLGEKFEIK